MAQFKFEITLNSDDLDGDEFWEEALKEDGTGVGLLTRSLIYAIDDSLILVGGQKEGKDVIKLIEYKEK